MKSYYEANKEQIKESKKAYYQAHKDEMKPKKKAYYEAHKDEMKAKKKAYHQTHKEEAKAYREAHKEQAKARMKSDVNSLGQTKNNIRAKSRRILKQMNLHIDGYQIHHCFGYDDPSKFIYCSIALHLKIHQLLRDNNISADSDHWMHIRDLVNSTDEFWYIKC